MRWFLVAFLVLLAFAAVGIGIMRRKPAAPALSEQARRTEANEIVKRLPTLNGYPFEVRYSDGAREQAVRLAGLTKDAYEYYAAIFPGVHPAFIATLIKPADWKRSYGMPSYVPA
jgi:hypothetical protein